MNNFDFTDKESDKKTPKKPFISRGLVRVSTKEQTLGMSLDGQEKIIKDYCKSTGRKLDKILYIESGDTARIPEESTIRSYKDNQFIVAYDNTRPVFNEMILDAQKGLFQELLIIKWDRFARRNTFQAEIKLYLESLGIRITPIQDTSDPLAVGITGIMNEKESDRIKERVERTMLFKAESGLPPQGIPRGYTAIKRNKKTIGVKINPKESLIIKEIFKLTSEGVNWRDICSKYSLCSSSYYSILKNTFYYGKTFYKGKLYDSKAEPIISKELFDKVQEKINRK